MAKSFKIEILQDLPRENMTHLKYAVGFHLCLIKSPIPHETKQLKNTLLEYYRICVGRIEKIVLERILIMSILRNKINIAVCFCTLENFQEKYPTEKVQKNRQKDLYNAVK